MKNPSSPGGKIKFYSALILAFLPASYGLYLIFGVLIVHQPYMLSSANPQLVLYDTVYRVSSSDGQSRRKVARGKRLSDNRSKAVHLIEICRRFPNQSCDEIEAIIQKQGLKVETYSFKNDAATFVLPKDELKQIRRVCWGKILSYLVFSIPFWLLFFSHHLRRLYYRYWYLPRYGDEDED